MDEGNPEPLCMPVEMCHLEHSSLSPRPENGFSVESPSRAAARMILVEHFPTDRRP